MTLASPQLPLDARIRLAHAVVQAIADDAGIDVLHIKGYAVDPGLYREGRSSTDVDVLARPHEAQALLDALRRHDWEVRTSFETGSHFAHAAVAWHEYWGWVDVHRHMPGLEIPPADAFERLWAGRKTVAIGGAACQVPLAEHQTLLILVHDARRPGTVNPDAQHLIDTLDAKMRARLEAEAAAFDAHLALAAATGRLDDHRDDPNYPVWATIRHGGDRAELLLARLRAARGPRAKLRLLAGAAVPNRDHLRMALGREPRMRDYIGDVGTRLRALVRGLGRLVRRTGAGGRR